MDIQPLYRLIYISKTVENISSEVIREILVGSRQRNEIFQISGLLIYMNGHFLQVLEGGKSEVEKLYQNICVDPRHVEAEILSAKKVDARLFSEWAMAFSEITGYEFNELSGFTSLTDLKLRDRDRQGKRVDELLHSFINTHSFG